uniref:Arginine/serine-rich protein 1 n=1 Tax=Pseudonaja textilis TaxID=8673 RepID=A0A670Y6X7_PSETE
MIGFMDDLTLSSPKGRSLSCSRSSCSKRSSSVSSNDSSYSSIISSSSTSWSRSRSRSRSHAKRICSRRSRGVFRGYSRSYSRSHSRSHNYRYRERSHFRYYGRHPSSHPIHQSRSRSPIRSYYHRCYSRSKSRICPEVYGRWRNCALTRPLRLTEKGIPGEKYWVVKVFQNSLENSLSRYEDGNPSFLVFLTTAVPCSVAEVEKSGNKDEVRGRVGKNISRHRTGSMSAALQSYRLYRGGQNR